ncbi:hypothetical protein EJ06DRAFT_525275 [Trichodelitschia bisporula]|uniref:Uncharacterized protein n=1 Tax=Trichodelitschia bisporula TaxID=703511 RepID=A0A6G1HID1_9PEZI|nr:hypothetical protein EJ06DRAFT_525275 [Trichodelitschia bisporula]
MAPNTSQTIKTYAIKKNADAETYTPNVLPCKIDYAGPVDASRYWKPEEGEDGNIMAHFRGRRLRGREVKVPEGYTGIVVEETDKTLPQEHQSHEDDEEDDEDSTPLSETHILEEVGKFDSVTMWGHEGAPDPNSDGITRAMTEWVHFAATIHSTDAPETVAKSKDGAQPA